MKSTSIWAKILLHDEDEDIQQEIFKASLTKKQTQTIQDNKNIDTILKQNVKTVQQTFNFFEVDENGFYKIEAKEEEIKPKKTVTNTRTIDFKPATLPTNSQPLIPPKKVNEETIKKVSEKTLTNDNKQTSSTSFVASDYLNITNKANSMELLLQNDNVQYEVPSVFQDTTNLKLYTKQELSQMTNLQIHQARNAQLAYWLKPTQKQFLAKSLNYHKFGCFLKIGGGKTLSALTWISYHFSLNKFKNVIVFAQPSKISDWKKDCDGFLKQKENQFIPFKTVIIEHLDDLKLLASKDFFNTIFLCSMNLLALNESNNTLFSLGWNFDNLAYVFDESSKLKNAKGTISNNMILLNYFCKYGLLLSGSLMSNGYEDLFTQAFLLDVDFSLNNISPKQNTNIQNYYDRLSKQRNFFHNNFLIYQQKNIKKRLSGSNHIIDMNINEVVGYRNENILINKLQKHSYILGDNHEVKQVDDNTFIKDNQAYKVYETIAYVDYKSVSVNENVDEYYQNNFKFDLNNFALEHNIALYGSELSLFSREWCSGFMQFDKNMIQTYHINTDNLILTDEDKYWLINPNNEKNKVLSDYLKQHDYTNAIVFYNFNYELFQIKQLAKQLNYEVVEINGSNKFKGIEAKNKVLVVAQYIAGSTGLNLQHFSNHVIFYSPSVSCENYLQAKGRVDRTGQTKDCYILNLLTRNSVEIKIYERLLQRKKYIDNTFSLKDLDQKEIKLNEYINQWENNDENNAIKKIRKNKANQKKEDDKNEEENYYFHKW